MIEQHINNLRSILSGFTLDTDHVKKYPWMNLVYRGPGIDYAHIEHYDNGKVEAFHFVLMPNNHTDCPIFGLDVVKISDGYMICMDATPTTKSQRILSPDLSLSYKMDERPDWATEFSDKMVLYRTKDPDEIQDILNESIDIFLQVMGYVYAANSVRSAQSVYAKKVRYIEMQRKNTKTYKALAAHVGAEMAKDFIENVLFPMPLDVDVLSDTDSYFSEIYQYTKESHKNAEATAFAQSMIRGTVSSQKYAEYLSKMQGIYSQIIKAPFDGFQLQLWMLLGYDAIDMISMGYMPSDNSISPELTPQEAASLYYVTALGWQYGGRYMAPAMVKFPTRHMQFDQHACTRKIRMQALPFITPGSVAWAYDYITQIYRGLE